ncbi:unnamed protein product [Adineta steineri]|uniref:NACHT domain-containing protein n=1 Tax=Adineta steineri TaxID=433720 RepID=A0A815RLB6_9BILA|nr:unnamed protein product [Adineta steineri]
MAEAATPIIEPMNNLTLSTDQKESEDMEYDEIKQKYQQYDIKRFTNSVTAFPIGQSYINLTIVATKEPEKIHSMKTPIDIKNIFDQCKDQTKKVLVLGQAGIGKSTFCQYAAYRWAQGELWSQYKLIILIPLRSLTTEHYPAPRFGEKYLLVDLLQNEYFPNHALSEAATQCFQQQCDKGQVLWLLDGYGEFVQNIPGHLRELFGHLCTTQHHIMTSSSYVISLSYPVQVQIIGFTDDAIHKYIKQFFDQIGREAQNSPREDEDRLSFLKRSPALWSIAHIPINLEIICSIWSDANCSEVKTMTMLYDKLIEWLCRRYLEKLKETQEETMTQVDTGDVYELCKDELAFLASLAFHRMESTTTVLGTEVQKKAEDKINCYLKDHPHLLDVGILKSITQPATGTQTEGEKHHYFAYLSFQKYFAARHLVAALIGDASDRMIEFIHRHKYNRRFELMLSFASGLHANNRNTSEIDLFWDTILAEPLDMLMQFLEIELKDKSASIRSGACETLGRIVKRAPTKYAIAALVSVLNDTDKDVRLMACEALAGIDKKAVTNDAIAVLVTALRHTNNDVKAGACKALGSIGAKAAANAVIAALVIVLRDANDDIRASACRALGQLGQQAATNDVVAALVIAVRDTNNDVKASACIALGQLGQQVATNDVIAPLVIALGDAHYNVRASACIALGTIGGKAATNEVIQALVTALGHVKSDVIANACEALGKIGEKAATNDVIAALVTALGHVNDNVRASACKALGQLGEKAATNAVIAALVIALGDAYYVVRAQACTAIGMIGEKAATNDVIAALVIALGDANDNVRASACKALGQLGEKAATNDVIAALVIALGDANDNVRASACKAFGQLGRKAPANEVIAALVTALRQTNNDVKAGACEALGRIGEKAGTNDVIAPLWIALDDANHGVRARACTAIGQLGGKAATTSVINGLLRISDMAACNSLKKILVSASSLSDLDTNTVLKLFNFWNRNPLLLDGISLKTIMVAYSDTRIAEWGSVIALHALCTRCAVTIVDKMITVYGNCEPVKFDMPCRILCDKLVDAFTKQEGLAFYLDGKQDHGEDQLASENIE